MGQREFSSARACKGGSFSAARAFMRAAAAILTTDAMRRSTRHSPGTTSYVGSGPHNAPLSALTIPYGSLRRGGAASQKLAEHLAEWGHMELHNGCALVC